MAAEADRTRQALIGTEPEFYRWLTCYPGRCIPRSPKQCLLARWLSQRAGVEVAVYVWGAVLPGGETVALPRWARRLLSAYDEGRREELPQEVVLA